MSEKQYDSNIYSAPHFFHSFHKNVEKKRIRRKKQFSNLFNTNINVYPMQETSPSPPPPQRTKLKHRWITESRDQFRYYSLHPKRPNIPFTHNYDKYDPYRMNNSTLPPSMFINKDSFLEDEGKREFIRKTRKMNKEYHENEYEKKHIGTVLIKSPVFNKKKRYIPNRDNEIGKAENLKNLIEEQDRDIRNKTYTKLKVKPFESEKIIEPEKIENISEINNEGDGRGMFKRPPFHMYGWANTKPAIGKNYLKTFNVNARRQSQMMNNIVPRRERTKGYEEWKNYVPNQYKEQPVKIEKIENKRRNSQKVIKKKKKKKRGKKKKFIAEKDDIVSEIRPDKDEGKGSYYHIEQIPENRSQQVERPVYPTENNQMGQNYEMISFPFSPEKHHNEEWDPKNYKFLPPNFTEYIKPAGEPAMTREEMFRKETVAKCLSQFD